MTDGITAIGDFEDLIVDPAIQVDDAFEAAYLTEENTETISLALTLIFALGLILSALPIIGETMSYCCKCYCLGRCIIKISWFISGLLGFILLAASAGILTILLATKDMCTLLDDTLDPLNGQTFLETYFDIDADVE